MHPKKGVNNDLKSDVAGMQNKPWRDIGYSKFHTLPSMK